MAPHLGPLPDAAPGRVHRVVAFIDRVDLGPSGEATAAAMVAGTPVVLDLQGRAIEGQQWACLDVTEGGRDLGEDRRGLTLLSVVETCPAESPEWAVRRHL